MGQTQGALSSLLSGKSAFNLNPSVTDKYFNNAVKTPLLRSFDQDIAPRIKEAFAGVQGFSTAQGAAQSQALGDLATQLAAGRADLAYKDQALAAQLADNAASRQVQGVSLANQFAQQPFQNALALSSASLPILGAMQNNSQQQAQAQYQEFLRTLPENSPWTNIGLSFIAQPQQAFYQNQNVGALGGGLLGGALGMTDLFGGFGSLINPLGFLGLGLGLTGVI
jgi:hypothetical protein